MPLQLDTQILTLMAQTAIRTNFICDLATPTPRKWTNYPGGITVANILGTLAVTAGGSGYTAVPDVTISGGGGQGAEALAVIAGGAVTGLVILSRGWGYTSAPSVAFSGGGGTGAAATATIGVTFPYLDSTFSPISESTDGTSVLAGSIVLANADNLATALVTDAANAAAVVAIQKVWRNSSDAAVATEIWLEGFLGKPSFAGEYVTLECYADTGRQGETPVTEWTEVLVGHTPPDEATASSPWVKKG
jgi:hypothetical protein